LFGAGLVVGGVGCLAEFAMAFVLVGVGCELVEQMVGPDQCHEVVGGQEGDEAFLPVVMAAFDFAFGLGRWGLKQLDAVEVPGGTDLGQRVGALRKDKSVVIDVEFECQAVFAEGGREEVEVSEEGFGVINRGPDADVRAVIKEIQEGIMFLVAGEPAMRGVASSSQSASSFRHCQRRAEAGRHRAGVE
jgi:hypothetical protein